jgi:hypothetical protein
MDVQYYEDDVHKFLTIDVMSEILAEFSWPASYTFDDSYPPDIVLKFPQSKFIFLEDFESNIHLIFSNDDTKREPGRGNYKLGHAITILLPEAKMNKDFQKPVLTDYSAEPPSLEKVKNSFRNLCVIMQTYLLPSIQGDFSWVERYDAYIRNKNNSQ